MPERTVTNRLEQELAALEMASGLRRLKLTPGLDLSSNDYLGLSTDPRLKEALMSALSAGLPAGSTGSRLLSGNARIWEDLESELAAFAGTEAALFFNSGYAANTGLLSSVLRPADTVFSDAGNHASIIDGIRLSRARKVIFPHLDLNFLGNALRRPVFDDGHKFIVVESVFSMEGDRAPLADLLMLAHRYGAELIVDEAHATGVFGPEGRGLVAEAAATRLTLATVHTCGKALGSVGAFVAGSETLKQFLINRARPFIFSTAMPPYVAAQVRAAIQIVREADEPRKQLARLAGLLREQAREAGFNIGRTDSQIVPVLLGENAVAMRVAKELQAGGFGVHAIRPPTVPPGTARLRLSVNAKLCAEDLERLVQLLAVTRRNILQEASVSRP